MGWGKFDKWATDNPFEMETNKGNLCRKNANDMHRMISLAYTEITNAL